MMMRKAQFERANNKFFIAYNNMKRMLHSSYIYISMYVLYLFGLMYAMAFHFICK